MNIGVSLPTRGTVGVDGDHLRESFAVVLPLAGVATSELAVYLGHPDTALWGYLVTLVLLTVAPLRLPEQAPIFRAFVLIPVFRFVNLGMPVFVELTVLWFPFVYGPLLPAVFVIARSNDAVTLATGWRATVAGAPFIVLVSVLLAEVEYAIIQPEALVPTATDPVALLVLGVVMIGFVGLVEELLFRATLQRTLQERVGRWTGLVLASAVFMAMHSVYAVPAELGFTLAFGLFAGVVYDATDSLATVVLIHGLMNVFLFGVIPNRGPLLAV
jgi:membrane protease YdiL (CAAX protease family)